MSKKNKSEAIVKQETDEEQRQRIMKIEACNAAAAKAIKAYQAVPETILSNVDGAAWHLHVLCRSNDSGFDYTEVEYYSYFIEQLIFFFLQSNNAKRFSKQIGNGTWLPERLSALAKFFNSLTYSKRTEAELDLISTERLCDVSERDCETLIGLYEREKRLQEARNAAFFTAEPSIAA